MTAAREIPSRDGGDVEALHVLMELSLSDLRIGAVNDAIDLAALARPLGVRFTFAGPLDTAFAAAAARRACQAARLSSTAFRCSATAVSAAICIGMSIVEKTRRPP
jgi:hypothetical protein